MRRRVVWVGAAGSTTGFGIIRSIYEVWGGGVEVIAGDSNPSHLVAASLLAKGFEQVPPAVDPGFPQLLTSGLTRHRVDTYVPVHDVEIHIAACLRRQHKIPANVTVLAPEAEVVERCNNKLLTYEALNKAGVATPLTLPLARAAWRIGGWVAKEQHGVGSKGVQLFAEKYEFLRFKKQREGYVVQARCGQPEVTLDVFISRSGVLVRTIGRERIEVKDGVCYKAKLFHTPEFDEIAIRVAGAIGITGVFTIQIMRNERMEWSVIDVNPRSGGGTHMSSKLGIHFAAANLADLWGENTEIFLPPLIGEHYVVRQPEEYLTQ